MKALVIGGNRFVGKRLVELLVQEGHQVDVLNRGNIPLYSSGVNSFLKADRRSKDHLQNAVADRNWDQVFDFACFNRKEAQDACEVFKDKTKSYLFVSSQSIYDAGENLKEFSFDPTTAELNSSVSEYGLDKRDAEIIFAKNAPWPVSMIRFPIILGPDDYTKRLNFHISRIRDGLPIYVPNILAKISFVQSEDAAKAVDYIAKSGLNGPINVCSEKPVSLKQLLEWIEIATGRKANLVSRSEMNKDNHSPFGIDTDWWMNADRLTHLGFKAGPIENWLPSLILKQ